jgi:hypothetical protein
MGTVASSETFVIVYQQTRRHIPEYRNPADITRHSGRTMNPTAQRHDGRQCVFRLFVCTADIGSILNVGGWASGTQHSHSPFR